MSLVPKNTQNLKDDTQAGEPGLQGISICTSSSALEEEVTDSDLPSSVVDEIEVRSPNLHVQEFYYISDFLLDNSVTERLTERLSSS